MDENDDINLLQSYKMSVSDMYGESDKEFLQLGLPWFHSLELPVPNQGTFPQWKPKPGIKMYISTCKC